MAFPSPSGNNPFGGGLGGRNGLKAGSTASSSKMKSRAKPPPQSEHSQSKMSFDMLAWYPKYQSCQRYFVDHSQHEVLVQCVAAFVNILLPYQRDPPQYSCRGARTAAERIEEITAARAGGIPPQEMAAIPTSLIPYLRRLIVTGMDVPQILHGFFGDDWQTGIGRQHEIERRNYLFAAKSGGWASVKRDYDILPLETVPFLIPLKDPTEGELEQAEKSWSEWLAMEDWMVGNRAPEHHRQND